MANLTARENYHYFFPQVTRWHDNDVYGHINNVVYYAFFDSAVNRFLISQCGLDIHDGETVAYVVASKCEYLSPISYPSNLDIGLRVNKLGSSSVEYGLAVFTDQQQQASAIGALTHVFVARKSGRATIMSDNVRHALRELI